MSIYVVTGGAGFIGSHLSTHLSEQGHEVRIFDNLSGAGSQERANRLLNLPNVSLYDGDIRDIGACRRVCVGAEFVLHHAAEASVIHSIEDPSNCAAINIDGTVNMLRAAAASRTVRRFVYASTCAIYGDGLEEIKSENLRSNPLTPYATTKLAGEHFCKNFYSLHQLECVILRYFNVYGPGQDPNGAYAAVIPKFMTNLVAGKPLVLYGDGEQSRDFIYVKDIVQANMLATDTRIPIGSQVINIGSGTNVSLNTLISMLKRITGDEIAIEHRDSRTGEIKHSCSDISKAKQILHFSPSMPLEHGLALTLHFYESYFAHSK